MSEQPVLRRSVLVLRLAEALFPLMVDDMNDAKEGSPHGL